MRKTVGALLTIAGLAAMAVGAHAQAAASREPGIYVDAGGKEIRIPGTMTQNVKQKGMAKAMFTGGLSKGSMVSTLNGAAADVRGPATAAFMIYLDPNAGKPTVNPNAMPDLATMQKAMSGDTMPPAKNGDEFLLIPLVVSGESRVAEISNGTKNKNAVPCEATKVSANVYKLQPKAPLAPGEYAFYWHMPGSGGGGGQFWTFGVDAK